MKAETYFSSVTMFLKHDLIASSQHKIKSGGISPDVSLKVHSCRGDNTIGFIPAVVAQSLSAKTFAQSLLRFSPSSSFCSQTLKSLLSSHVISELTNHVGVCGAPVMMDNNLQADFDKESFVLIS